MLQIVGYFEGRGQVLAYAKNRGQAEFVANVLASFLTGEWLVDIQPEGQAVNQMVRYA